jgi:hypothetical protein
MTAVMHLLQGFVLVISLVVQVTALIACNDTGVKSDQTVTTTTTVTPIITMLEPNPNYTEVMLAYPNSTTITVTVTMSCPEPEDSAEIYTTLSAKVQHPPALINSSALATNTERPLMALRTPPASPTSITICNFAVGNTGFNSTNNCSLSGPTSFVLSTTSTLASTSTVMSTANLPTPSLPSDTTESTSTTVVVVSLATSTPTASATFVQGTSTTTSTSAARPRPQPLSALFWFNLVAARARDQISNAFEGWAKAEKAKSFFDTEGAALDATTTANQYPTTTTTVTSSTGNTISGGGSSDAVHLPLAFWAWLW